MNVSSRKLAADLAETIGEIAPEGLSLRAAGPAIEVCTADGRLLGGLSALEIIDENDDRSAAERIEVAVDATVSGIQDVIIEFHTHASWPGDPHGGGAGLPLPECRVTGEHLQVWFGSETAPAISLPPITLKGDRQ